jgi:hypothetical protein
MLLLNTFIFVWYTSKTYELSKLRLLTSTLSNPYIYICRYFENTYFNLFFHFCLYLRAINQFSGSVELERTNRHIITILNVFLNHSNKLFLSPSFSQPIRTKTTDNIEVAIGNLIIK